MTSFARFMNDDVITKIRREISALHEQARTTPDMGEAIRLTARIGGLSQALSFVEEEEARRGREDSEALRQARELREERDILRDQVSELRERLNILAEDVRVFQLVSEAIETVREKLSLKDLTP